MASHEHIETNVAKALGKGEKAKTLWSCLLLAVFWVLRMERNRRIFDDYKGVEVEVLWERAKFWAALWASVTADFWAHSISSIMLNLSMDTLESSSMLMITGSIRWWSN